MWGVKYRREILHEGRWELESKVGTKLLTISEILKHLSNRTEHASEKCNEHMEMTALYLGYLWEAITWHQTAEPAGLTSYGTDTDAAQTGASGWRLRDKQPQKEGAQ